MNEKEQEVLKYIKSGSSLIKIEKELLINRHELIKILNSLRNKCYSFKYEYSSGGIITISIDKSPYIKDDNSERINLEHKNNYTRPIRLLVISDTHMGSIKERLDLLEKVYSFALDNHYHNILHIGDFIDGKINKAYTNYKSVESQLLNALRKYPYDECINNFLVLGNHDYFPLLDDGFNPLEMIKRRRLDIIPISYKYGRVLLGEDSIGMFHSISNVPLEKTRDRIMLYGHGHYYHFDKEKDSNDINIHVPCLCDINITGSSADIGMLTLDISFYDRRFKNVIINQYKMNGDISLISETEHQFIKRK